MIIQKVNDFISQLPENKTPVAELRMSSAGECERKLDYEHQQGPRPIGFQNFMRMETGTYIHDMMRDIVSRSLGEDFYDCERDIALTSRGGIVIPGHPDGRVRSLKATVEFKSCSDSTFAMVSKQNRPLDQHIEQGNIYAFTLKDEWVLIVYYNKDSGLFREFMFETDPEMAERTIAKFDRVAERKKTGVLSPRTYTDMTEAPCFYCPFKEDCYADFRNQVASGNTAEGLEELSGILDQACLSREIRLMNEKQEDLIKKEVGKQLHSKGINSALIKLKNGKARVNLTVGKNNNLLVAIKEIKDE